jgi:hypothetical protein
MGKIKISELNTNTIQDDDVLPFVKVPASGVKTNYKATLLQLQQYILGGLNLSGIAEAVHVDFVNDSNAVFGAEYLICNEVVLQHQDIVKPIEYIASYTNSNPYPVAVLVSNNMHVDATIATIIINAARLAWATYTIKLLATIRGNTFELHRQSYTSSFHSVLNNSMAVAENSFTQTGIINLDVNDTLILSLELSINEFHTTDIQNTQQALAIRTYKTETPQANLLIFKSI